VHANTHVHTIVVVCVRDAGSSRPSSTTTGWRSREDSLSLARGREQSVRPVVSSSPPHPPHHVPRVPHDPRPSPCSFDVIVPALPGGLFGGAAQPLSSLLRTVTLPFFLFKQAVSVVQMLTAARRILRIDEGIVAARNAAAAAAAGPASAAKGEGEESAAVSSGGGGGGSSGGKRGRASSRKPVVGK
jgi:hypothetical protein